jgi:hypothetical protein
METHGYITDLKQYIKARMRQLASVSPLRGGGGDTALNTEGKAALNGQKKNLY